MQEEYKPRPHYDFVRDWCLSGSDAKECPDLYQRACAVVEKYEAATEAECWQLKQEIKSPAASDAPLTITDLARGILKLCDEPAPASQAKPVEVPKVKQKRGPKTTIDRDKKIAKEYDDGLEEGLWIDHADYLKQRHADRYKKRSPNAVAAWFSSLLKRVEEWEAEEQKVKSM